jgi:hypothetical protein
MLMRETKRNNHELQSIISTRTWKSNKLIPIINVSQPTSNGHCNLLKQSNL